MFKKRIFIEFFIVLAHAHSANSTTQIHQTKRLKSHFAEGKQFLIGSATEFSVILNTFVKKKSIIIQKICKILRV